MLTPENHDPEKSEATRDSSSASSVATQASDLALMNIGDGYALLFADHTPQDVSLLGFDALGREAGQRLSDKISAVVGAGNLAALGGPSALPDVQGIVRLAPESMQLLNQTGNSLMQSSGQSLGAIVNANGTIVGQARLLPLAEGAGSMLGPMLGPAMVLLALQMQLASISRRVDENIELTRDVLRTIHEDQWTTLLGLHETSLHALNEAEAAGTVNDHIFAPLATRQADLRKYRNLFVNFVKAHIKALNGDHKNSRSYIQKQFDQIIADTHGMLMAEFAWYRAQVLRGILIGQDAKNLDANNRLLAHLVEETKREHDDAMLEITSLLTEVERQVRLLSVLPVARSLPFTSKRRNIDDAVKMTEALSTSVAALRNQIHAPRELANPKLSIFKAELPDKMREILTWALPEDSQILVLADANQEKLLSNNVYLGIAKEYFFVADQGEFNKEGSIESITPLTDIRYVRYLERSKKGPSLEIITKDENLTFTFDSWAAEGEALAATHRLANVFSSVMNLPEEEKREDSLLEITHTPPTLIKAVSA
ncbi:hypothetical protein [Glutamicibacter ardleyensis]|uniref:Uncharacterized protein n=1 Tax=Glutamicibacter ardleyensis TaxID=225894 RepID=A0ABQ2DSL7_9MICC|nr:hypothetical protein [Glutamicibacter ardleyensis]GGJ71434.1 hypothetical protein GCM10007173_32890 [Glutamicibacter ardleyensis]